MPFKRFAKHYSQGAWRGAIPKLHTNTPTAILRKSAYIKSEAQRIAELVSTCDVFGCGKKPTRFVGSKYIGWLHFCSKHKEAAERINRYFLQHPQARPRNPKPWERIKRENKNQAGQGSKGRVLPI